jgi:hypothetical protein
MNKRLLMFGLIFISVPQILNAQALLPDDYHAVKIVPSPTASSISKYQETPVDLFTGTPSISVPLTSIEYGSIKVPVTLSYHSTGIKVAEHPGWAGLGWDVITGGQITRKVNWYPDEYFNRHPNYGSQMIDKGYYFLGNMLNTPNWNTSSQMMAYAQIDASGNNPNLPALCDGEPDEFNFNFAGYSGMFYLSETGQWQVKSKDNIQFEIQSQIDTSATLKLYSDFDLLTGAYIDSTNAISTGNYEYVSSLFTKFTIITPDGYRYEFGGDKSAIEFSRGSIANTAAAGLGLGPFEDRRNNITANTWNLTKITTPLGESISFNYQRGKVIFTENRYPSLYYDLENPSNSGAQTAHYGDILSFGASSTNPSFLASIETPTKKVEFVKSQAVEYPIEPVPESLLPPGESAMQFVQPFSFNWKDISYAFYYPNTNKFPHNNQQLDSIKVFDKLTNTYVNGIKFFQRGDATKRRTLDSIGFYDLNNIIQKYKFQYSHVDDLPKYESLRRDHWGYFNGGTEPTGPGGWPIRTSNTLSTYGMISKIIYPTGGETDFEFEPGYYGSVVHVDPNNAQPISLIASAGNSAGVRIKSLTSIANDGSPALTTQYYYTNSYATGGNSPSGILSSEPRYIDNIEFDNSGGTSGLAGPCGGHFYLQNRTDDNSEWMDQAKGGIVTYSEVTAKSADGSFVTTKYTNNDNAQYQDEIGLYYNFGGTTTSQSNYRLSSNDLERGKLLSQASYNSSGVKVKELLYTYVNDPARKNLFTKCFAKKVLYGAADFNSYCAGMGLGGGARYWAYKIYSYQNPIKTLTETTYENNQPITETKTFSYDTYGNVTRTIKTRSDNDVQVEDVQYNVNNNFQGTAVSSYAIRLKNLLSTYRIKNYPVERTTTLRMAANPTVGSDRIISGTLYEYDNALPLLSRIQAMELSTPYYPQTYTGGGGGGITNNYLPASINSSGNFVYDSKYKPQVTIYDYSLNIIGNQSSQPLAVSKKTGDEAYTWDYGLSYLSSFTTNCRTTQAAFTSFEGSYLGNGANDDNNGNWKFYNNFIVNGGFTGQRCTHNKL